MLRSHPRKNVPQNNARISRVRKGRVRKSFPNIIIAFVGIVCVIWMLAVVFVHQHSKRTEHSMHAVITGRGQGGNSYENKDKTSYSKSNSNSQLKRKKLQKLIIHVGPFKTGTTSIQNAVFQHLTPKVHSMFETEMVQDNFKLYDVDFNSGLSLVHHLNAQSNITTAGPVNDDYNSLKQMLNDARASKQHVVLSSETLSYLKASEEAKASFLSLTEGFDVRIVMAYRPLESYYSRSWYIEHRSGDVYWTGRKQQWRTWESRATELSNYNAEWSRSTFPEWFTDVTEKYGGNDPLYTYETYKYVFSGEERIKVIQLHHPDKVDIVLEQLFLQRDGSQALM